MSLVYTGSAEGKPMDFTTDHALAATATSLLAALWFAWTVRHTGTWSRLLPWVGVGLSGVVAVSGAVTAARTWSDGTVVTGGVVSIYVAALLCHALITRLCTGALANQYRRAVAGAKDEDKAGVTAGKSRLHLIPTVVAVSTAIQVAIIANTLDVQDLYLGAVAVFLLALAAWPVGGVVAALARPRGRRSTFAVAHPLTGLLTGAGLVATAILVLLPPP